MSRFFKETTCCRLGRSGAHLQPISDHEQVLNHFREDVPGPLWEFCLQVDHANMQATQRQGIKHDAHDVPLFLSLCRKVAICTKFLRCLCKHDISHDWQFAVATAESII